MKKRIQLAVAWIRASVSAMGTDLMGAIGVAFIVYGLYLIYQPLAYLVIGAALLTVAITRALAKAPKKAKD